LIPLIADSGKKGGLPVNRAPRSPTAAGQGIQAKANKNFQIQQNFVKQKTTVCVFDTFD